MLFSIPLLVLFSSMCLITKHMEIDENNEEMEMVIGSTSIEPSYVNANTVTNSGMKMSYHEVEEQVMVVNNNGYKTRFKECRRNHSFGNGGYTVDGCLAFLPDGVEGTREFMICGVCKCHRNYHRQETIVVVGESPLNPSFHHQPTPLTTVIQTPTGYLQINGPPKGTTSTALALPSSSSVVPNETSKKRFRTRFTHEQKQKMFGYAEKLGWKVKKKDDKIVQDFCNEIGVTCQVFKVWVHNNKHTLGNKP